MKKNYAFQTIFFAGLIMNCSAPQNAGSHFIRIANDTAEVLLYKVADRSGHSKEPCCSGKGYSFVSYVKNDIVLHLVYSKASAIREIVYRTKDKKVILPKAAMIYKMPTSPLMTCVVIRPGDLGVLTAFDSLRMPRIIIDCKALFNEIRALKNALDPSSQTVYYDKLPPEMFMKKSNGGEPRQ